MTSAKAGGTRRSKALLKEATSQDGRLREILDASSSLFERHGYQAVSMEDIADAVGLRKPSLYHYVKSKDEVLWLLHTEFMTLVFERYDARIKAALPPEQLLLEFMADMFGLMATHRGHVRVFFEHHRELPPRERKLAYEERLRYRLLMEDAIQNMVDTKRFTVRDVQVTALAVFGMCNWAYQWYDPTGPWKPRELAQMCWDLVVNGMRSPVL